MAANVMLTIRDAVAEMLRTETGLSVYTTWTPDVTNPATTLASPRIDVIPLGMEFDGGSRGGASETVTIGVCLRRYGTDDASAEAHGLQFTTIVDALYANPLLGGKVGIRELAVSDAIDADVWRDNGVCMGVVEVKYLSTLLLTRN